jgi:hypothetical protein
VLRWGLIPFWAKDAKIAYSTNAMVETAATKPAITLPAFIHSLGRQCYRDRVLSLSTPSVD